MWRHSSARRRDPARRARPHASRQAIDRPKIHHCPRDTTDNNRLTAEARAPKSVLRTHAPATHLSIPPRVYVLRVAAI